MNKLVSILTLILLLWTNLFFSKNISAATNTEYVNAVNLGEQLKNTTEQYNQRINEGEMVTLNFQYDSLSSLISRTEKAIGKVPGHSVRKSLNEKYVNSAKIARERVIYEVSQFRLLNIIEGHLEEGNMTKLNYDLGKLNRLKSRAIEIKKAGGYASLPFSVQRTLSQWESDIRNHKLSTENQVIESEIEPNDTKDSANLIYSGVIYKGRTSIYQDVDYYKFVTNGPGEIRIILTDLPNDYYFMNDYVTELYDRAGKRISSAVTYGDPNEAITVRGEYAGNYFVKVYRAGGNYDDQHEYKLKATFKADNSNGSNDTKENATPIENGRYYQQTTELAPDNDWYSIVPDSKGDLYVTLDNLSHDFEVFLYNNVGEQIGRRSPAAGNRPETIYVENANASTYYVLVSGGANSKGYHYRLRADFAKKDNYFTGLAEPNNVKNNAFPLIKNISYEFKIENKLDKDWFKITPNAGTVKVVLDKMPADYNLYVYDRYGTLLNFSINTGQSKEEIVYNVQEKGTYFIQVIPAGDYLLNSDNIIGTYRLSAFYK
ncbi:hypothetical protein [Metabacillus fastidiosus]|uniref:hypothetical protein n=1 Tax=Metabacillus fastidiosus TaxID=1458 RepID=UPI003D27D4B3